MEPEEAQTGPATLETEQKLKAQSGAAVAAEPVTQPGSGSAPSRVTSTVPGGPSMHMQEAGAGCQAESPLRKETHPVPEAPAAAAEGTFTPCSDAATPANADPLPTVSSFQVEVPVGHKVMKRKAARHSDVAGPSGSKKVKTSALPVPPPLEATRSRRRCTATPTYAESSDEDAEHADASKDSNGPTAAAMAAAGSESEGRDAKGKAPKSRSPAKQKGKGKSQTPSKAKGKAAKAPKTLKQPKSMPNLQQSNRPSNRASLADSRPSLGQMPSFVLSMQAPEDPATGDWVEPTGRLVWAFIAVAPQDASAAEREQVHRGFWWPAELAWDEEDDMPDYPLRPKLFIDPHKEILKFSEPAIEIKSPSRESLLSFKIDGMGARCSTANFRRNLPSPPVATLGEDEDLEVVSSSSTVAAAVVSSSPSDAAFSAVRRAAFERDSECNEGLPDPVYMADSVHATPQKNRLKEDTALESNDEASPANKKNKSLQWYPSDAPLEQLDFRTQEKTTGLGRTTFNGTVYWWPVQLVKAEPPKPIAKGGEFRNPRSLQITWHVLQPFDKRTRKLVGSDFVPAWHPRFPKIKMSEFESTGKISPRQLLLRLHGDIMPLLEVVIRGQEPSTQDAHLKFLQSTTLQREQALSEVRFKGDWSDSLLEKISDFCTKWCCRESLGRDVEPRGPGDEAFESLNQEALRLYSVTVLEPLVLRLLTLNDEPQLQAKAKEQHPDDAVAETLEAHRLAAEFLKEASWVTEVVERWHAAQGTKLVNKATAEWRDKGNEEGKQEQEEQAS